MRSFCACFARLREWHRLTQSLMDGRCICGQMEVVCHIDWMIYCPVLSSSLLACLHSCLSVLGGVQRKVMNIMTLLWYLALYRTSICVYYVFTAYIAVPSHVKQILQRLRGHEMMPINTFNSDSFTISIEINFRSCITSLNSKGGQLA